MTNFLRWSLTCLVTVVLSGCGGGGGDGGSENHPPVANAGDDQAITEGSTATLTCRGTDKDRDILNYRWLSGTTELVKSATYTTPDDLSVGDHTYTCEVSDSVAVDTDSVKITVKAADTDPGASSESKMMLPPSTNGLPPLPNI